MRNTAKYRATERLYGHPSLSGRIQESFALQRLPPRTAEGEALREVFGPKPGYLLLSVDYSALELRVGASILAGRV